MKTKNVGVLSAIFILSTMLIQAGRIFYECITSDSYTWRLYASFIGGLGLLSLVVLGVYSMISKPDSNG